MVEQLGGQISVGQERRQDLEYARDHYILTSQAFTPKTRKQALTLVKQLIKHAEVLSNEDFLVGFLQIAACAQNGHDVFDFGMNSWRPEKRLPLRLIWFPDGLIVARTAPNQAALLGSRVLRIEALTPGEMLLGLETVSGGIPQYRMWDSIWIIETMGLLHAMGLARNKDRLRLVLATPKGRRIIREIPFVPHDEVPQGPSIRLWSHEPFDVEVKLGWQNVAPRNSPLYLQDPDIPYRTVPLPNLNASYIQFRTNLDSDEYSLQEFLTKTTASLKMQTPSRIIVDLRFNSGGNIDLTRAWLRTLPQLATQIYVLVSRYTFSAGIVAAAALKHDSNDRAILVGEPVGDRSRFWSEGGWVKMPCSGYMLHKTTGLWDLIQGCKGEDGCYGDNYDATVDSLDPDIEAALTAKTWIKGVDPMMESVQGHLQKSGILENRSRKKLRDL